MQISNLLAFIDCEITAKEPRNKCEKTPEREEKRERRE
jgi:hypothetical protein